MSSRRGPLDIGRVDLARESKEYRELARLVRRSGRRARRPPGAAGDEDEAYLGLLAKERRVLDTVDRVVNDARRHRLERASLWNQPAHVLLARLADALRLTFKDLVAARSLEDVREAVADSERRAYLGLALVLAALAMLVLDAL